MPIDPKPLTVVAADAPARTRPSNYPEPFASRMAGKREMKQCILVDLTFLADNLPQDSADKLWEYIEAQKSTPVYN